MFNVSDWPFCLPFVPKCCVKCAFHDVFAILWLDTISQSLDFKQVSPPGCTFFCSCRLHSSSCWLTELCDFSRRAMAVSNCGLLLWCLLEHSCYQHQRLALVNVFHHFLCIYLYLFSSLALYSFFRWYFNSIFKKDYAFFSFPFLASLCFFLPFFLSVLIVYGSLSLFLSFSCLRSCVLVSGFVFISLFLYFSFLYLKILIERRVS